MTNKRQYSSLDKYNSLDLRAKKTLEFLDKNPAPFKRLNKYVIQRILALSINDFMIKFQKKDLKLKVFSFDSEKRFVISSKAILVKYIVTFIFLWTAIFVAYLIFLAFPRKKNIGSITLVYGFEHVNYSIKKNHDYIKKYLADNLKISSFSGKNVFVVSKLSRASKDIQFFSRLSLYIKLFSCLDNQGIIFAIKEHLNFFNSFFKSLQHSILYSLLALEFPIMSLFSALNKFKLLDNAVFSNSNMLKQPLWCSLEQKEFKTHMFWYSQNSYPLVFHKRNISHVYPPLHYIEVSFHWIWDNSFQLFLKKVGVTGSFKKSEPIIFSDIKISKSIIPNKNLKIMIFDVFPSANDFYSRHGINDSYYNYKIMTKFILDILNCAKKIKTQKKLFIYLKHKRGSSDVVDARYIDFIADLARKNKIKILPHQYDLKSLIAKANLVITPPYSSPFYIAKIHHVNACFYDSSSSIIPPMHHIKNDLIRSPANLLKFMRNSLR